MSNSNNIFEIFLAHCIVSHQSSDLGFYLLSFSPSSYLCLRRMLVSSDISGMLTARTATVTGIPLQWLLSTLSPLNQVSSRSVHKSGVIFWRSSNYCPRPGSLPRLLIVTQLCNEVGYENALLTHKKQIVQGPDSGAKSCSFQSPFKYFRNKFG